ncbi:LysM peptidoglycan-binding domain-containing protein [Brachyspira hyodysenteriae]|uniref:LysM peptidoglycan-binding domain-containing protein n=1 Tax=Brachyspira hyodysenteriae TaxID=159 RepID=UPI001ADD6B9A|nr:LysM peptidoglycan-binding domain-containing protein [Brachyspira hyodysenteriae]MCZ9980731.1 LysM peptidoglycan-binding domain-containing protein [Brachyspira hyodysenteriae]MDA0080108.1 LysM peptidoglycan-binding domain-containing protein [Brachyspira hyodysenteriae]QTM05412.1 LysM peptidoglycan-binding domain-containing protein [Brachyspira hyodysenteriae]QTM08077.1 LysM peptidoglycan-binding domain-containing protein [Brachyspira hyodysenteriae]
MKKGLFLFILLTFSCFLYAQETNELVLPPELPADLPASIKESDDYKLAQRYREMAIDAHSVGDYNQSIEYSRQSKEYSDKIILRYGVYEYVLNSQRDAERKLSLFKGVGGDTNELTTSLYEESVTDINSAHSMLEASTNSTDYTNTMLEYNKSAEKSELGYNVLAIDLRREYLMSESVLTNGDNNDTQITNLRDESKNALSSGDYTNSLTKSREAMNILDMLEAPLAYAKAQDSMDKAKQDGFNNSKPNLYTEALKSLSSAGETLIANNYTDSLMHSKNVISLVNSMESTSGDIGATEEVIVTDGTVFPQYYIVQSRRANTDSLWRIASYDFIYGNGNLWRRIYEANRDTIKDPNVIRAGQRLVIPSLKGETRQGTYSTNQTYGNITTFSTNQIEGNIIIEDEEAMEAQAEQTEETVIDEQTDTADENAEMTEDTTTADENAEMTEDTAATDENTEMTEDTAATDENTEMTEDDTTVTDETAAEEGNQ